MDTLIWNFNNASLSFLFILFHSYFFFHLFFSSLSYWNSSSQNFILFTLISSAPRIIYDKIVLLNKKWSNILIRILDFLVYFFSSLLWFSNVFCYMYCKYFHFFWATFPDFSPWFLPHIKGISQVPWNLWQSIMLQRDI